MERELLKQEKLPVVIYQQEYKGIDVDEMTQEYRKLRECVPTSLFLLGVEAGYFEADTAKLDYQLFMDALDWDEDFNKNPEGWIRPKVVQRLRRDYGMSIVSWRDFPHPDIGAMKQSGYIESAREEEFFLGTVMGKTLPEIVQAGNFVLASVKAGFATNRSSHGVIILSWTDEEVVVQDSDNRAARNKYLPEYVADYLDGTGGGFTVVLPKE